MVAILVKDLVAFLEVEARPDQDPGVRLGGGHDLAQRLGKINTYSIHIL